MFEDGDALVDYARGDYAHGDYAHGDYALVDDAHGDDALVDDALGGFGDVPGTSFVFSGTGTGAPHALHGAYLGDDDDGGLRSCAGYDQDCDFDVVDLYTEGNADTRFAEDQFALQVRSMSAAGADDNANLAREANGQIFEGLQQTICGSTEKDLAMKTGEFPDCPDGLKVIEFLQVNNFEAAAEVVAQGDHSFKKACIEGYVRACKHTQAQRKRNITLCSESMCSKQAQSQCLGFCNQHAPSDSPYKQNKGQPRKRKSTLCSESMCSKQAQSRCLGFCAQHAPSDSDYKQKV